VLSYRYWNVGKLGVAVVAVRGFAGYDWAAYLGGLPNPALTEEVVIHVMGEGAKLRESEARAFFPEVDLEYRP
jgi:hypothetical protein